MARRLFEGGKLHENTILELDAYLVQQMNKLIAPDSTLINNITKEQTIDIMVSSFVHNKRCMKKISVHYYIRQDLFAISTIIANFLLEKKPRLKRAGN